MMVLLVNILILLLVLGIFYLIGSLIVKSTNLPHGQEILYIVILIVVLFVLIGLFTGHAQLPLKW